MMGIGAKVSGLIYSVREKRNKIEKGILIFPKPPVHY